MCVDPGLIKKVRCKLCKKEYYTTDESLGHDDCPKKIKVATATLTKKNTGSAGSDAIFWE